MKYLIIAIVILIIGAGIIIENRYDIKIHSPIVAKLDRLTGDVYIANSGYWNKIQAPGQGYNQSVNQPAQAVAAQGVDKPKQ